MPSERVPQALLAMCVVRLDTDRGPQGTAFFVAPQYALTAAHVVDGILGAQVRLHGRTDIWPGRVEDARPPASAGTAGSGRTYPAPDIALIKVDDGPQHECALLDDRFPPDGATVMARGHTRTFDGVTVTAETETFQLTGELETPDPGCRLLKLGMGQAAKGMSGAPVLDRGTGMVIGMLRTSRGVETNLGAWVVPVSLVGRLWPRVSLANDRYHREHSLWRSAASELRQRSADSPPSEAGLSVRDIRGEVISIVTGGHVGNLSINADRPGGCRRHHGEDGAR